MGNEFQKALDQDNLNEARKNLNEFTGRISKKSFMREIENVDNLYIDEMQLGFVNANPELTFEEMRLIKKFSDYMKSR